MNIETFYNTIADEFNKTRIRLWDCVKNYFAAGNGKYMNYRKDIIMKGIDISIELVKICNKKNLK